MRKFSDCFTNRVQLTDMVHPESEVDLTLGKSDVVAETFILKFFQMDAMIVLFFPKCCSNHAYGR